VNVSKTTTGKYSWDTTVEGEGWTKEAILKRSDEIVAELEKRYPAEIKEIK